MWCFTRTICLTPTTNNYSYQSTQVLLQINLNIVDWVLFENDLPDIYNE